MKLILFLICFIPFAAKSDVTLQEVFSGFERPVLMVPQPKLSGQFIVGEQGGKLFAVQTNSSKRTLVLDISGKVSTSSEQGLLGLAFDPNFSTSKRLFVNYTRKDGATVVSSFTFDSRNQSKVNAKSEQVRLVVKQPFENHNGGHIVFGSDKMLYIGLGDGGSGGDPQGNGQRLTTLLGKILRINVSAARGYTVPRDNPFATVSGVRPEIYAYGLRNPWRFNFDRVTKRLFVGDVGQNSEEEVSIVESGDNLGWNTTEGTRCYLPSEGCDRTGLKSPITTYGRTSGQSVTGGYVYRGKKYPTLQGLYVFGDFGSGVIFGLSEQSDGSWVSSVLLESGLNISSFAQSTSGELFVLDYSGKIYSIQGSPAH